MVRTHAGRGGFADGQVGDARNERFALRERLGVRIVDAMEIRDDRSLDAGEAGGFRCFRDAGLVRPVDGEAGLAEVRLGIVFGFLEQLEAMVLQVHLEDVAGGAVEPFGGGRVLGEKHGDG